MGMYTLFQFNAELTKETPQDVIDILDAMTKGEAHLMDISRLPGHEFFSCDRWNRLFTSGSYYFPHITWSRLNFDQGDWYLSVQSNLKNYNDEITKFIDWIDPYVEHCRGGFMGLMMYEEEPVPTIIYKGGIYSRCEEVSA